LIAVPLENGTRLEVSDSSAGGRPLPRFFAIRY
jgi:hypothetical protein